MNSHLPTQTQVVIIGGGIVGSSIAWHLTHAGCKNVLVIERESSQGKGSTGKSMGGVRAQFSTPVNIQMSLYSIPFYQRFDEMMDHPGGYRPQGYMFLATQQKHLDYLNANFERQTALGLATVRKITKETGKSYLQTQKNLPDTIVVTKDPSSGSTTAPQGRGD